MSQDDMMPVEPTPETMWTLSDDRRRVRMSLPPLPIAHFPEPLQVHMDFDAAAVDELMDHLFRLRADVLPAPKPRN